MDNSKVKVILLLGQRIRSGTNFVGTTLSQHPDVVTIPPQLSNGEFNLFRNDIIESHFQQIIKGSFKLGLEEKHFPLFIQPYFQAWMDLILKTYDLEKSDKTIFIKSPIIDNYELWRLALPKAKITLITRDGRDNVISSVKAANDKRRWHTLNIKAKKRINYYSGRSFVQHSKSWRDTAIKLYKINSDDNTYKVKYEDLNNSSENIEKLLNFYELRSDKNILESCLAAPVIGSSWGINKSKIIKPNWQPDYNKSRYKFSKKWTNWNSIKKIVFKNIAGKQLIKLGFEKDKHW